MQWLRRLAPPDYDRQTLIDDLIAGATGDQHFKEADLPYGFEDF